jgi:hypothetical protein
MSEADLTRWNRAGLSRFRYVDANAATLLEALRIELAGNFKQWNALKSDAPLDETATERTARIVKQYNADRRDWAWESTRAFARALHVLTEHLDAFANEGYLRTATQWQSIRRLAAMVGYMPATASSATTPLVLIAKDEVITATLSRGFGVKHIPASAPPIIFETLQDLEIAPQLNVLRLVGWNKNKNPLTEVMLFTILPTQLAWPVPKGVKVSTGGLAILAGADAQALLAVQIASTDGQTLTLASAAAALGATFAKTFSSGLTFDTALLHAAPAQILVPFLNGADVVRVVAPHDFKPGEVVAWKPAGGVTQFAKVLDAQPVALRLQPASPLPAVGAALYRAVPITQAQFTANNSEWRLPTADRMPRSADFRITFAGTDGKLDPGFALTSSNAPEAKFPAGDPNAGDSKGYVIVNASLINGAQIWFADPGRDKPVTLVAGNILPDKTKTLEFDGKPPALASGDLVILQTTSASMPTGYAAGRIDRIEKDAASYRLVFTPAFGTTTVTAVHASFGAVMHPPGYDSDPTLLADNNLDFEHGDGAQWPALLQRGRQLVLETDDGAFMTRIAVLDPAHWTVRIDRSASEMAEQQIPRGRLAIRANVVDAGHGETKPLRVLGNGDASTTNQRFVIDVDDISQVRDVSLPGGIRADITVEAEREIYSQVATLRDSEPADPHFVARVTEAGTLELGFGDGRHGRRLPSGANNVVATIRRGSGLAGNLPPGALTDIVKKHPAVASFLQPIAAAGGDEREALGQIRQAAPGRLSAMDRAISVLDYQRLAQRFQGVWHAAAFEQPNFQRSREAVRLVIVPAGGGALGELGDQLRGYLTTNGLPSIDVAIEPFVPLAAEIAVTARVDSTRYDPREVEGRVRAAVIAGFDLRLRKPGQPFYRSEVTRIVENTEGVSNSDVALFKSVAPGNEPDWRHAARGDDNGIWAVFPNDDQVIYAKAPTLITVATAEATI